MRIGFDAKRAFCNFRGLGNYSRSLISSLAKYFPDNNEFFLYTPKVHPDFNYFLVHEPKVQRIFPTGFPFQSLHPLWRSFKMSDEIRSRNIDLFHGLSHEIPRGLAGGRVRTVVTIHDLMYIHFPQFFPWIDRLTYDQKVRYACENSDSVIAICEQTKGDLINYYRIEEQKIKVIYQSIDERFFSATHENYPLPDKVKEKGYILGVGAFVENKNFEGLIQAYARLHKFIPQQLVLVGFGSQKRMAAYQRLAEKLGCASKVFYLTDVSASQLSSLYKRAHLFVLPSFHEGFGLPIIEAMSQGCPVVTTAGGAHEESAGKSAVLINPNSIESISQGMLQLIENKGKREELIELGLKRSQLFHPQKVSQLLFNHYETITK